MENDDDKPFTLEGFSEDITYALAALTASIGRSLPRGESQQLSFLLSRAAKRAPGDRLVAQTLLQSFAKIARKSSRRGKYRSRKQ